MTKSNIQQCFLMSAFVLLNSGCTVTPKMNYSQAIIHDEKPVIQIDNNKYYALEKKRTFTVIPASLFAAGRAHIYNEDEEQHLLFILRNMLEGRGYRFVPADASPDLVATVDGYAEYQQHLTRPVIRIASRWNIGGRYSLKKPYSNLKSLSKLGDRAYQWGRFSTAAEITANDDTTNLAQQLSDSYNYPHIRLSLFDGSNRKLVWSGLGSGVSKSADFYMASQLILRSLLGRLPLSVYRVDSFPRRSGKIGMAYMIASVNGQSYYPMVTGLSKNSPARQAGIKPGDMITEINDSPTLNNATGEIADQLSGEACTILKLQIKREEKGFSRSLRRVWRNAADEARHESEHQRGQARESSSYLIHPEYTGLADALAEVSQLQLSKMFSDVKKEQIAQIKIVAYTDSRRLSKQAQKQYRNNKVLSLARASRVSEYLAELLELNPQQLIVEGKGEAEPLSTNKTQQGRAQNRRVEITLTRLLETTKKSACETH